MESFTYDEQFRRELAAHAHHFGEVRLLEGAAAAGMTAVDVGANRGVTTVAMAGRVGPTGRVYAFEPVPEYYGVLRATLSRNGADNVTALPMALGDRGGHITYYKCGEGSGIVSQDGAEEIQVAVTGFDAFADANGVGHVDLINMDCEGSELLALRGAERTLRTGPVTLLCEVHRGRLDALGQSPRQIVTWLEERGFAVQPVLAEDLQKQADYDNCTHLFATRDVEIASGDTGVQKRPT